LDAEQQLRSIRTSRSLRTTDENQGWLAAF
jgi:hypothetical protein